MSASAASSTSASAGSSSLPVLAVTLGDPAGIGPEIVARTLADPETAAVGRGIAVGDAAVLRRAVAVCGLDGVRVNVIGAPGEARFEPGSIDVLDLGIVAGDLAWGKVSAEAGRSAVAAIETATRVALDGEVDGIVTAPINKEAIWAAGSQHLGHTEMLGELTGAAHFDTMFVVRGLKIFFTTRHVALRKALDQITEERVAASIRHAVTALRVFGHDEPRLAVAAINPHGGEGGHFGDEEITALRPAVEKAAAEGHGVYGPVPADSVFHQGLAGRYDGVLSHFHDQGHIPAKTVDFDGTVSVTVGLPILRTSVDHGTAFDIAGTGKASPGTMAAAFRAAADFSRFTDRIRAAYGTGVRP
ncbi:4-hydroxythreonine-4-phosphate dehydrogenase PdxA [Streptomyces purpurogeneiscleroticus]|uniref:4-hydroxythreonine-4-phosphate dehydrogenase PdxA n=1 Tax=Streptomyces purpurogeneiscleroticus TaxID=68259 RepID=UPI001CBE91F2|nr:4-hydroxythreonine-4-phosphate dehydrogenase PdxA [Streptomyces purpurogeneiscleroticus]MBZ4014860.1 4-hydroxythreonine-4-phosphate dehydrogenase PdxA [Streptomyces purpurogeneiscleroticus]